MALQKQEQKLKSKKKEVDLKNNKKIFLEYNIISTSTGKIK